MMAKAHQPVIVRAARFYDGTHADPLRDVTILAVEGAIVEIAAEGVGLSSRPTDAAELSAACVIPGLVNAHVHLEMSGEPHSTGVFVLTTPTQRALICAENARKQLYSGVTAVRDLGASESLSIDVRDAIAAGRIPGPDVYAAGNPICITGGHGWWVGREADGPWDVRTAVREQLKRGANCIKLIATGGVLTKGAVPGISQLSQEEMSAAVSEAHGHGLRVTAHAIGTGGILNALRAGVDSIEHGHLLDDEAIALFLERGAWLVPTLTAIDCIVNGPPSGDRSKLGDQPEFVLRKARELARSAVENISRAVRAGVRIAAGADSGTPFNYHENFWYELVLMQQQLGMDVRSVLHAATQSAAELLGSPAGVLAVGRPADLVLLDRDLESDLRGALESPQAVVKAGRFVFSR